jgi:hypothetical protein
MATTTGEGGVANPEHVKILKRGVAEWNEWRRANPTIRPDLDGETCIHQGPSVIDHQTLQKSGPLPLAFLRGVGLPDNLIDYLPSLLNQAIQRYSCFISYSAKDDEFANRIHADLPKQGGTLLVCAARPAYRRQDLGRHRRGDQIARQAIAYSFGKFHRERLG